ncbi:G2/M phase-specific E3 ubiquitin-protein ligase-like [Corticium candelabrum]|uniref:G2/M phase-specific E3 ubiquitin-protein ligase-like n=1 Tax=Corticium candelabrum TaxID=121492 RepID=UPI002E2645D3|nr:G2/M phase-specific E3 ubiquitin-protein ligase-like [Corticium candelabrum]
MIAASALQGGPGFPCLAPAIYTYMATMSLDSVIDEISPLDLPDPNLADTVEKISEMNDDSSPEFQSLVASLGEFIIAAGYTHKVTATNKADMVLKIFLHEIVLSRKAELDQLSVGLGPLMDLARRHPDKIRPLLTASASTPLTSGLFLNLVTYESTLSPNLKDCFVHYVHHSESTNLRTLLQFCTGCNEIPVMGFHEPSTITVSSTRSVFPNAATCAMILELPRQVDNQDEFTANMNAVLDMQATGFGVV